MNSNASKPPVDANEIFKQLQGELRDTQAKQKAANAKNPNYRFLPELYATRCEAWAKRDLWTLGVLSITVRCMCIH